MGWKKRGGGGSVKPAFNLGLLVCWCCLGTSKKPDVIHAHPSALLVYSGPTLSNCNQNPRNTLEHSSRLTCYFSSFARYFFLKKKGEKKTEVMFEGVRHPRALVSATKVELCRPSCSTKRCCKILVGKVCSCALLFSASFTKSESL